METSMDSVKKATIEECIELCNMIKDSSWVPAFRIGAKHCSDMLQDKLWRDSIHEKYKIESIHADYKKKEVFRNLSKKLDSRGN